MENEKLNITASPGVAEIIVRHGEALELLQPARIDIKGTIDAPLRFLQNRIEKADGPGGIEDTIIQFAANILVNKEAGTIILIMDEHNPLHDKITGTITLDDKIRTFNINDGKYITPEDMSNFIRTRKHLFESQAQYTEIFTALRNFRAKVNQVIAAIKDDSGNFEQKKEQAVEHNIPRSFKLTLPIFKGMPKVTFEVEFLVNKSLDVTMYSAELIQVIDELRERYINEIILSIEVVAPDIVILYQ